jgi:hypothetical protein
MLFRTIQYFEARAFSLRPFYRFDVRSRTGRLIESHCIRLDDVVWC